MITFCFQWSPPDIEYRAYLAQESLTAEDDSSMANPAPLRTVLDRQVACWTGMKAG